MVHKWDILNISRLPLSVESKRMERSALKCVSLVQDLRDLRLDVRALLSSSPHAAGRSR